MTWIVLVYLLTVVMANLAITHFGPSAVIPVAFLAIGFDLTARDALHEAWHGNALLLKMALLILAGSAISYLLNQDSLRVGIASFVAFASAGVADTAAYEKLYHRGKLAKVNGSNVVSAAVDSLVFPTLAFGALLPGAIAGQFGAKVLGGALWSVILKHTLWREG